MLKFYLLVLLLLVSCTQSPLKKVLELPESLKESSGVEVTSRSRLVWTLEDQGNAAKIYGLNPSGKIAQTIAVTNVQNKDWEDIASDASGNLYIGDFGNNENDRKDLAIYKIEASALNQASATASLKINFYFPEQKSFPPKKSHRVYDVEAFFFYNDHFYLFTKNRSSKFDGTTVLYQVPNKSGNHAAKRVGEFVTCDRFNHCAVTSADISPDGTTVALLSGSYVWLFTDFNGVNFLKGKVKQIDLAHLSQKEGICFSGNDKLLISDERKKNTGGNLYAIDLKN